VKSLTVHYGFPGSFLHLITINETHTFNGKNTRARAHTHTHTHTHTQHKTPLEECSARPRNHYMAPLNT